MTDPVRLARGAVGRGAPMVGRTVPGWSVTALGVVAGAGGAFVAVGSGGWLALAFALVVAGAVFPRGPFAALVVVQIAVAAVNDSAPGPWQVAVVIGTTHLVLAVSFLAAWIPRGARVQLRALRRPALRFAAVDAFAQVVAVLVTVLSGGPVVGAPGSGSAAVWIGIVGGIALLGLAVSLLVPVFRPSSTDR
ncbi:hypothetical protein [Curtobacterium sp. Leaf261]|uniref:hypothetical protein n=1 Tax=Curtobacterium sp. Leaf261 TaxID=1736311 RepID=UPI0007009170|nr:hypothetical protein [Curtobacterium sp. Leaf261]KQO64875.1 hypothetical protein ASF23_01460 [Curtobacterium sp. Leaf261]